MLNSLIGIIASSGGVAGGDYESIATVTLGSAASSITFSSIPSTYSHLQIRGYGLATANGLSFRMRANNDSGSNYAIHALLGDGASASAAAITSTTSVIVGTAPESTTYGGVFVCDVLDYSNTNKNKTTRSLAGADMNGSGGYSVLYSGLWMSTSAIDRLDVLVLTNNFAAGSTFALYGIKG